MSTLNAHQTATKSEITAALSRFVKTVITRRSNRLLEASRSLYPRVGRGVFVLTFESPEEIQDAIDCFEQENTETPEITYFNRNVNDPEDFDITNGEIDRYDPQTSFFLGMLVKNEGVLHLHQVIQYVPETPDVYYIVSPGPKRTVPN